MITGEILTSFYHSIKTDGRADSLFKCCAESAKFVSVHNHYYDLLWRWLSSLGKIGSKTLFSLILKVVLGHLRFMKQYIWSRGCPLTNVIISSMLKRGSNFYKFICTHVVHTFFLFLFYVLGNWGEKLPVSVRCPFGVNILFVKV